MNIEAELAKPITLTRDGIKIGDTVCGGVLEENIRVESPASNGGLWEVTVTFVSTTEPTLDLGEVRRNRYRTVNEIKV